MSLETEGKKIMLEAFGAEGVRCRLYDETETELSGEGYAEQTISWTYNAGTVKLEADEIAEEDHIAEFSVPAGTVKFIGVLNTTGVLLSLYDLGTSAENFTNPGVYQILSGTLELDPS